MDTLSSRNHILIINYPGEFQLRALIDIIQTAELHTEIFVLDGQLKDLPFRMPRVDFVSGSITAPETYQRAELERAKRVLILKSSENPTLSDSVGVAVTSLIKTQVPTLFVAVECLKPEHAPLLKRAGADSIIYSQQIFQQILSQAVIDPGCAEILEHLSHKNSKHTLYRTIIGKLSGYCTYPLFAKRLIDKGYSFIAMRREGNIHFQCHGETLKQGDEIYYIGRHRLNWIEIKKEATLPK